MLNLLAELKLIEREPGMKLRLLVDSHVNWRRGGPLWQRYRVAVQRQFFNDRFDHAEAGLWFDTAELSLQARGILAQKLKQFEQDFAALAEMSRDAAVDQCESVGVLLASRPWHFRQIDELDPNTAFDSLGRTPQAG